jgi:hypothetical protein
MFECPQRHVPRPMQHRSATLEVERFPGPVGPTPVTTRRPFRKSSCNMRSITTVRSRPGTGAYGSRPRLGAPYRVPSRESRGHDQWPPGQKRPAGVVSSPALPGSGPLGSPSSLSAGWPLSLSSRLRVLVSPARMRVRETVKDYSGKSSLPLVRVCITSRAPERAVACAATEETRARCGPCCMTTACR